MSHAINVFLDDGRIYEYDVVDEMKAREHASSIVKFGYRHSGDGVWEWYPSHRIVKVRVVGQMSTNYNDRPRGT